LFGLRLQLLAPALRGRWPDDIKLSDIEPGLRLPPPVVAVSDVRHPSRAGVGSVIPKVMPVILTTEAELDNWMAPRGMRPKTLQRPLSDVGLKIVARGADK
jgi:hypothetical protein